MDSETLKYLRALKDKIAEAAGPLQYGDQFIINVGSGIGLEDFFYSPDEWGDEDLTDAIRVPLAIDPEHPERGLWGMVDWMHVTLKTIGLHGKVSITIFNAVKASYHTEEVGTPYLALLKALAHQIGIEVKE